MHQPFDKYLIFRNRLQKVFRHLSKQAARQGITCYRVYDHDLPEAPFIIEVYEDKLYVSEYKRRHHLDEEAYEQWLHESKVIMSEVIGVAYENIYLKLRQRKESRQGQYQKLDALKSEFEVQEGELKFLVNLTDYLDTGLFLDHRITRQMVKEVAKGKRVLNLFCYTGSFSVYAAAAEASKIVSVDLSKTYLHWAERNVKLNFPEYGHHTIVHADVLAYLKGEKAETFDIIVLDPPTFSNSKRMDDFLDIQRDHVTLINNCMRLLSPGGVLFFSTNFTKFKLAERHIKASTIKDITKATTPFDFAGKLQRYCFRIGK
ncbi:MAG: methyltransferase protein [Flaviaesturariibacter sp.]|nr:methyltransferase protein [Flaviaesturariibacter sp.]